MIPLAFACSALGLLVFSSFHSIGVVAIVLATSSLLVIMTRLVLTWREYLALLRTTQAEALTDALTGMANRRALTLELERRTDAVRGKNSFALALFDLDGFKHYNDSFGHPAGDALLQRLGARLQDQLAGDGSAYRMGGDEFCVLIDCADECQLRVREAAAALSEHGEGFAIGCPFGLVLLPAEADEVSTALRLADQRMYAHKHSSRVSASRQSGDVLVRVLAERDPSLSHHMEEVAQLAEATARRLSLPQADVERFARRPSCTTLARSLFPMRSSTSRRV